MEGHHKEPLQKPGIATAEHGQVMLDGPNGVAITLTAEAAENTARSLLAAAAKAKQQEQDD